MIGNKWDEILKEEFNKDYFKQLTEFVEKEYEMKNIYPSKENIFEAFKRTDYDDVKVVILGQDPYHGPNQAEGLSFSVSNNVSKPPSLKNIFKELENDIGIQFPEVNSLKSWADRGVLLLNSVLTVEEHKPASHSKKGWETFTDNFMGKLFKRKETLNNKSKSFYY